MNIEVNKIDEPKVKLLIESDWESIKDSYEDIFEEFAMTPIKGFRTGKAPRKIVEQRYGTSIIKEVGSNCSQNLCKQAMISRDLQAGSPISISEIHVKKGGSISFTAEFILMPEFELPNMANLQLLSESDEDQKDEISRFLLANTEVEIPDEMIHQEMELSGFKPEPSDLENWNAAKDRASLLLIISKIAEQDGIEVDDKDVEERTQMVAKENGTTSIELKHMLLSNGGLSRLRKFMLAESVLDYIIDQSNFSARENEHLQA